MTATQGPPGHAPAGCRPVIQDPEAERATAAVRQAGLNALAAQSGWRADCDPTVDGDSLVWIDETDNVAATLTATDDCVCAITRLFLERPAADACCTALALYLLRLSAQVRLVRMTLEESNLVLESILPATADVGTVSTVLGALSAAMAWCRDEAEVLVRAPAVAEAYLKFSAVCAGLWRTQSSDEKPSVPAVSVAGVM